MMTPSESKLAPLLSTHDLRLACPQCCEQKGEITYELKSVQHQCERRLLLCRVKDARTWRPVFRRPTFPNPSKYQVCDFFIEGSGCSQHKNRCTFARSDEEAAVWTFQKRHCADHGLLCQLVTQSERGSDPPDTSEPLAELFKTLDLKAACAVCSTREKEITYSVKSVGHKCGRDLLLAKTKASQQWRPVSERPTAGQFGPKVFYQECLFFSEGSGCTQHGQKCTFARSFEEAMVWNHVRDTNMERDELLRLVAESEAAQLTPEHAAESLLQQFAGEFMELCKGCFQDRPQKLMGKRWNNTCSADAAHQWEPVLVHHLSENNGKHVYSQVRPLRPNCQFIFCSHVKQGKPCWHPAGHCGSAQSEVEMAVWRAEHAGLFVRPHLLHLSHSEATRHRPGTFFCKVCLLVLSSPESFYKHCSSVEHAQLLSEDTTTRWRGRQPPRGPQADLWLCDRPETCEYGVRCPKAHSVEELKEWMMRSAEEKEIRHNIEAQGLMCYNEKILEEYKNSSNEVHVMSEQVDDVNISCDGDLMVQVEQVHAELQWIFQVETERQLVHVALLKQEPGASFTLGDISALPCIYSSGSHFVSGDTTFSITVSFTSLHPGLYEQWLVLDFAMRPVLLKKLRVKVSQPSLDETPEADVTSGASFQTAERWHRGNRFIIPCSSRTEEQEELLKEYKPPQINFQYTSSHRDQGPLTQENYRERMHQFLYHEERAEEQIVSRLNVLGEVATLDSLTSTKFSIVTAPPHGQLFCGVSIPCDLTPDTPEGQVLRRSIQSALIAPYSSSGQNSKVYEATILHEKTSANQMYLELSRKCCADLSLTSNKSYRMEVQFQLNRRSFCYMHKAVDLLPDTTRVLPDLQHCEVPVNNIRHEKLNTKQQAAMDFITGNVAVPKKVAPLLIYGPFGTGKTFTLATAARELCKQPHNKVLICSYTNSSADLYVRDHLHPFIAGRNDFLRPIRIKANKEGKAVSATDDVTLKYCLLSRDGRSFLPPTKAVLDGHRIVITTTAMARHFHELKLPEGYFTHILIDEASQMLECEALMALGLAGPGTRLVLAGDHMQMGPKLFSVDDHHRSNHTLLNRLFHYYQGQKSDTAASSRIIFSENYRSAKEIVEFVSTYFYVGKNDVIRAMGDVSPPADGHALRFHHVRGECLLDVGSMSWYNREEVSTVVEAVKEILKGWPTTWGTKDQGSICVLSERVQVRHIRSALSKKGFSGVHVENLANVQGKQFRVVILTAVQTRDSLKTSHLAGLELFNDARVLNTAVTRAQSLVVVVGDAAALCCFGKCSGVWKSYVDHCISKKSVSPKHFTKEFHEKDVLETARFQKFERVDEENTLTDAILQELTGKYEQLETDLSSDEEEPEVTDTDQPRRRLSHRSTGNEDLLEFCEEQPENFKQGRMVRESYNRGYVIPLNDPGTRVPIQGRTNMGKSFTGDEVVLQTANVVHITKRAEAARVLVCLLEDEDHSKTRKPTEKPHITRLMMPISKSAPKVQILILKKRRNFMPIWKQTDGRWTVVGHQRMDEKLRQNHVFVVQVLCWKDSFPFPLGKVIDVVPIGRSLSDGLRVLNEEFQVAPNSSKIFKENEDRTRRENLHDVITFTVDPQEAKDLDDAISIRDMRDQYELGVHIADVASYVHPGETVDEQAKNRGTSRYPRGAKPFHMFPENWSTEHLSLLEGEDRRVVSLMFRVNKQTHEIIGEPEFKLSLIRSKKKFSYEEAEKLISEKYQTGPKFATVEDCVSVAYCFAKAQRKKRLQLDWAYYQAEDTKVPGKRKARLMIEELSVLYNTCASKTLTDSDQTKYCTPLRCQEEPESKKVKEFKTICGALIPLSFAVRHKVVTNGQRPTCQNFPILTNVWEAIQSAAEADDVDKMVDLIAADDIHPLLQPVADHFRQCYSKATVIPYGASSRENFGHYSLNVSSYTQASSPIRRYMDIVVQRLLHSHICKTDVQYTRKHITSLCNDFEELSKKDKEYEQKAEQMFYAVSMKKQSASKLAFVVSVESATDNFRVAFPFNKNMFRGGLAVFYKELQLWDQPEYDETSQSIRLTWKRRIYAADAMPIHEELRKLNFGPCLELPLAHWKRTVEALDAENWDHAKMLMSVKLKTVKEQEPLPSCQEPSAKTDTSKKKGLKEVQSGHEVVINLALKRGDTLQIQMTSEVKRGYNMPAVQLVHIKPKFEICVDHVHSPIMCFSKSADDPTKIFYKDIDEYVQTWRPLCEMESASNAVNEEDSIVIEKMKVTFNRKKKGSLSGSFFLPAAHIREWAIDCTLSKCLLCIRKRGLKLPEAPELSAIVDPKEFTWVAHGVTTVVEQKKKPPNEGSRVEFYINHLPMEDIPDCVFEEKTRFTVEIIPKPLPDIRKENAVVSVRDACELVQMIALGHCPREAESGPSFRMTDHLAGLPGLNTSQRAAVKNALKATFTLIQGPPGTGKTVVGAYIVYHFFEMNLQTPRKSGDPKDKNKKQVILYCGPSNKSVDVVAEYLLKIGDKLRPLRVYSHQVEMLDYPYPDGSQQFPRRTLRQERAKAELRSITLHHRMREDHNPYSDEIKAFDKRIQSALENEGRAEALTDEEVEQYKKLLQEARTYELERHDIILCTCTQASSPRLTRTVSARQILIDESAMATEPQALIPLVCNKPEKIVLIGDHKQLQPVVRNEHVRRLGVAKSLFERFYNMPGRTAVMLDTQYRMHRDICSFPSKQYYDGKLKTDVEPPSSALCVGGRSMRIVFGDCRGETSSLVVNTAKGNENSKENQKERTRVVEIAQQLVKKARVPQEDIVILSPYNAQVSEIRRELRDKHLSHISATTITKSQGSEWRYVFISTVVSVPSHEMESEPDGGWLSKHVGFVGSPNQINVAVTRAKDGLCIIGNQQLLSCSRAWKKLLDHYKQNGAVTEAEKVSVVDLQTPRSRNT